MDKKNCTKVGLVGKSKAAVGEKVRGQQIGIWRINMNSKETKTSSILASMEIIKKDYEEVYNIFVLEKESFKQRKELVDNIVFTSIKWSSSYIDFFPYESVINQLKPAVFYRKEKKTSIKNCYLDDKLIFACNNERENWGSLFIENDIKSKKLFLFVENDNGDMTLQQVKVAHYQSNRCTKAVSYINDENNDEETLIIDLFKYDNRENTIKIIRHGFYEEKKNILPIIEFDFTYIDNTVKIFAKEKLCKKTLIYEGKKLQA